MKYPLEKFIANVLYGNPNITTEELIERLQQKLKREVEK